MNTTLFAWSVSSGIIILAGMAAYKFAIDGTRARRLSHIVLLAIALVAVIAPIALHPSAGGGIIAFGPATVAMADAQAPAAPSAAATLSIGSHLADVLSWIYLGGVGFMLARLIVSAAAIARLANESRTEYTADGIKVHFHTREALGPCSFGKLIFIPEGMDGADLHMAVEHELAHCRRGHWAEQLLAELLIAFTWYNPGSYCLRHYLREVQEFEADMDVIEAGNPPAAYQMLLIRTAVGKRFELLANNLNNSSLKKRITMMKIKKTPVGRIVLRSLALIPALAVSLAAASVIPMRAAQANTAANTTEMAQTATAAPEEAGDAVAAPDVRPQFPGGDGAMFDYLAKNIKFPEEGKKINEAHRVVVRFVVEPDGSTSSFEVVRKSDIQAFNDEAVRVIKEMPKWTPGQKDGKAVRCTYTLPVVYKAN